MAFKSNRANAEGHIINAVIYGVDAAEADIVQMAVPLANIDTGALRGSIKAVPAKRQGNEIVGVVGSFDIEYAIPQEFGPYGKPYMRPSIRAKGTAENIAKHARTAF